MKLISRVKGGLGNQLFCYAAARRLALVNGAELVLDSTTGFVRDHEFRREFLLHNFPIHGRIATRAERLEPFERIRRGFRKKLQKLVAFEKRDYIEEEQSDFDRRLVRLKLTHPATYIDGLWQSRFYFLDVENTLKLELIPPTPSDLLNVELGGRFRTSQSVAVHVRWFALPRASSLENVSQSFYTQALRVIQKRIPECHFVVFSDNIPAARELLKLPPERCEFISHNNGAAAALQDFWLMTQCRHFIIANSTFSWWAAWLSQTGSNKTVLFPRDVHRRLQWAWDFTGQMPEDWTPINV